MQGVLNFRQNVSWKLLEIIPAALLETLCPDKALQDVIIGIPQITDLYGIVSNHGPWVNFLYVEGIKPRGRPWETCSDIMERWTQQLHKEDATDCSKWAK